jgi:hypothetical protein
LSTTDRAEAPPDVYFLPEYGQAASIADGGEWLGIEAYDGAWRMPLIVRALPDGALDAITPTFSGIYASPALAPEQVREAWSSTLDNLRHRGVISVVVRGSPVVPQATPLPGLSPISTDRPTVVLDLSDESAAWAGLRSSCRSRIRKAQRNGYTGTVRPAAVEDLMPGGDFRDLYELTMTRRAADPLYFFDDRYYARLLAGLGANLLLAEVRDRHSTVVSACLLMRHGAQRLHYHLAGSAADHAGMGTNNMLMWTGIQFAIAEGLGHFHVGAGVTLRDSLFRFKKTFGGREATYDVLGMIVDDEAYQQRVRKRAGELDVSVEALAATRFFPAYRAAPAGSA